METKLSKMPVGTIVELRRTLARGSANETVFTERWCKTPDHWNLLPEFGPISNKYVDAYASCFEVVSVTRTRTRRFNCFELLSVRAVQPRS